jgi:eukaryotic-like serine/threonine-protein kinase
LMQERAGQWDKAIRTLSEVVRLRTAKLGPGHFRTLRSVNVLAGAHMRAQHWTQAEATLRECLDLYARALPDDEARFRTISQLGAALLGQKKYADAEPLLIGGYQGLKARESQLGVAAKKHLADAAARIVPFVRVGTARNTSPTDLR